MHAPQLHARAFGRAACAGRAQPRQCAHARPLLRPRFDIHSGPRLHLRGSSRVRGTHWTQYEVATLQTALQDVVAAKGPQFTHQDVADRFLELSPGTDRVKKGIMVQAQLLVAASAGGGAGAGGAPIVKAAPVTLVHMIAEALSVRPNMEATRAELQADVGSHPIYARHLNWAPGSRKNLDYAWQKTLQNALCEKRMFIPLREGSGPRLYRLDPSTGECAVFWRAAPYALASLLATYLPKNEATVEELTDALVTHPLYYEVLAAKFSNEDAAVLAERVVHQVARELESHPELFTPRVAKGAAVYSAVITPFIKPPPAGAQGV